MSPDSNCGNCSFMELQPVALPDGTPVIGQTHMMCKRFPPQVVAVQNGPSVNLMPMFPPVNASVWCYEWEAENGAQDALDA